MKSRLTCELIAPVAAMLCVLLVVPCASAKSHKDHPYRYSVVDMPVSLAEGTVQTPEFPVDSHGYWILVQVEEPLPFHQMSCMMGVVEGPFDLKYCDSNDPLLRADWTVWDGEHVLYRGSIPDRCACKFNNRYIFKFLGKFPGEAGRKYVVKVTFTKDGTPLDVANPHLIVTKIGNE